ncbi:MAG: hypothetical protein DRJ42_21500 [Deltaproteobacteria bacterium]|nr:MAG: hypothetical protein DRJ42_21500 [Deltaproteobacteria bacterium]
MSYGPRAVRTALLSGLLIALFSGAAPSFAQTPAPGAAEAAPDSPGDAADPTPSDAADEGEPAGDEQTSADPAPAVADDIGDAGDATASASTGDIDDADAPGAGAVGQPASPEAAAAAAVSAEGEEAAGNEGDVDDEAPEFWSAFAFGSYGRVVAASDLMGGTGRDADIVAFDPRIDEGTYLELELRREDQWAFMQSKIVATLAIGGPLFHFDGDFDEVLAIRNLYLELIDVAAPGVSIWAGSRMWRGDDMYLLDTWPLDNLNAVGGGLDYTHDLFQLRSAVALARPNDPFQTQIIDVPPEDGSFTPTDVFILDRPRLVLALKGTYFPFGTGEDHGAKLVLYTEYHSISDGNRQTDDGTVEALPSDDGYVIGAQLGGWLVDDHAFINIFARYARGLGAYDPLGVPFSTGAVISTAAAEETLIALSANYEYDFMGVQVAAYYRRFRDADPSLLERNLLGEGAIDIRPHVWFLDWLGLAVDLSYQALEETGLDVTTDEPVGGEVWKLGILPFISPGGRGTYTRPHLRLIYSATFRDEGARRLYHSADPRASREVEHFIGIGAEWWIDTSSYLGPQLR